MLALGLDRPRGGDGETGLDQGREERLPGLLLLVGEHDGQDAVIPEHATTLGEGVRHLPAIEGAGLELRLAGRAVALPLSAAHGAIAMTAQVDNCLVVVRTEIGREPLRAPMALRALQPDVEEVG